MDKGQRPSVFAMTEEVAVKALDRRSGDRSDRGSGRHAGQNDVAEEAWE